MNGAMELVSVFDSSTATSKGNGAAEGKNFGYIDANSVTRYQQTQFSSPTLDYYRIYKVDVAIHHDGGDGDSVPYYQTVDGQNYTDAQVWAMLSSTKFKITVDNTDAHSIAYFFAATDSTSAIVAGSDSELKISAATDVVATEANLVTPSFYFGMYIDGESHNQALVDENLQDGDFTVTLAKAN